MNRYVTIKCVHLCLLLPISVMGMATAQAQTSAPTGSIVGAIKTGSGNYLTAVDGGGLVDQDTGPDGFPLATNATVAGKSETFSIIWLNSTFTQFALRTPNGDYVEAVNGGGVCGPNDSTSPIHTDANSVSTWETFQLNFLPNALVTINTSNGDFVSAVNGGGMRGPASSIETDASQIGPNETFTLISQGQQPSTAVSVTPVTPTMNAPPNQNQTPSGEQRNNPQTYNDPAVVGNLYKMMMPAIISVGGSPDCQQGFEDGYNDGYKAMPPSKIISLGTTSQQGYLAGRQLEDNVNNIALEIKNDVKLSTDGGTYQECHDIGIKTAQAELLTLSIEASGPQFTASAAQIMANEAAPDTDNPDPNDASDQQ